MEVILLERVQKLGQIGDVVNVKNGYARNFLLPQKKALRATKSNMAVFEAQRKEIEANNLAAKQDAEAVAEKMQGISAILIRQAGDSGQLFGSVSSRDVVSILADQDFKIERKQVVLDRAIKFLGIYDVEIRLHPEVSVTASINIARSEEEAESQAAGEVAAAEAEDEEISVEDYFENVEDAEAAVEAEAEETEEEASSEEVAEEVSEEAADDEETKS